MKLSSAIISRIQRSRKRAPNLSTYERTIFGLLAAFIPYKRLLANAVLIKPGTILKFHKALIKRKYSALYSNTSPKKPDPKGTEAEVIEAIVTMKEKNPRFENLRIAMQIRASFGIEIDKDVVRRVLANH